MKLEPKNDIIASVFNRSKHDLIIFRHGHIAINNYRLGDNKEFERSLSVWNKQYYRYEMKGGYYIPEVGEFRISRGYSPSSLKYFFPNRKAVVENKPYKHIDNPMKLLVAPNKDVQNVALTHMLSKGPYEDMAKYTQQIIDADVGEGKAQPNDTLIPTPTGLRKLKDLEVGDKVFNLSGDPVKVLAIYPQKGLQETYEVTLKDGRKTRCNSEHLWRVVTKSGTVKVIPLSEIIKDYMMINSSGKFVGNRYAVPLPGPVRYKRQDVPVDPYILGLLIGNGDLDAKALTISSGNFNIPAEIARRIKCPTHFRKYGNYNYHFIKDAVEGSNGKTRYSYMQTRDFLKDLPELIGSKSGTKFIPDLYKYNSVKVRRAVLQGLMDTDGHISKDKYKTTYSTTSTHLKDDIVELVRSLGYLAYVTEDSRHEKYKSGCCYRINIVCPDADKPLLFHANPKSVNRAKKAADTYKTKRRDDVINIIDIKKVEPSKQRCIYIDDPLHVYVSENYIPTHNTFCSVAATTFLAARAVVFVPFTKLVEQWADSYINFTNLEKGDILIVKGSKDCEKIRKGEYLGKKIFIFVIDTLSSYTRKYGNLKAMEMLSMTGAYVKFIDEAHRKLGAINMVEALCNFKMNYYMTASFGRADKDEDKIIKKLFQNVPRFGSAFLKHSEEKHLNIIIKKYRFMPTNLQVSQMYRRNVGLNIKSYENVLITAPVEQKRDFEKSLKSMLSWSLKKVRPENKILILCSTLNGIEYVQNLLLSLTNLTEIGVYHSKIKAADKPRQLEKRVIISTDGSLGTGADIKGLEHVHNIITYSNAISAKQLPGRGRSIEGVKIVYIEYVNIGYHKTADQYARRKPALEKNTATGRVEEID